MNVRNYPQILLRKHNSGETVAAPPGQLSYSSDGQRLVVGHGKRLRVYDLASGLLLEEFHESSEVTSVAFTADNQKLVVGRRGAANNAAIENLRLESWIVGHDGPVTIFSPLMGMG